MNSPRHRPLSLGHLRAFEAVARQLNFRAAAQDLHLTQPAVSRQIQGLEDEVGVALFLRGTRHVQLTPQGAQLLRSVAPLLAQLDDTVRSLRAHQRRQPVGVATFASFASLWLLPRLADFQNQHPASDIRIVAQDEMASPDDPDIDLALRYCSAAQAGEGAVALFDEALTPVASPALLQRLPLRTPDNLAQHVLLDLDDPRPSGAVLNWRHWLGLQKLPQLQPKSWVSLNYTHQQVQAALAHQGVALARLPLVQHLLDQGSLVEPFGAQGRVATPNRYWLVRWRARHERPALAAFEDWVQAQAALTRAGLPRAEADLIDAVVASMPSAKSMPKRRRGTVACRPV